MSKKKQKKAAPVVVQNAPSEKPPEPQQSPVEAAPKLAPIDWGVNNQQWE